MARLPRDLSGRDLARALRRYGYEVTRETRSHMRLTNAAGWRAPRHDSRFTPASASVRSPASWLTWRTILGSSAARFVAELFER